MADVVVTVPKALWDDWLAEGDLPGDPWGGNYWSFYAGGAFPASVQRTGARWNAHGFWPEPDGSHHPPLQWNDLADWSNEWWLTAPDQRCYIVAHGWLRGFAPLFAIEVKSGTGALKAFIRRGGAEAVTIPGEIRGFQGWRYRWWDRSAEVPFPNWITEGVPSQAPTSRAILHS